ncbi:MAG: type II secretion system protein GspD [Deltaproteobacteria bacterium]|nr:MAG: type II secretion system protein GspD [Deltaproteobacteria bacterium]
MKSHQNIVKIVVAFSMVFLLLQPAVGAEKKAGQTGKLVSIDFNNVDLNVLIKFISELTGKNFVIDQRVKGKATIISPSKISVTEAYKVFESVLEVHGFTTIQAGKIIKIVPSPDARSKNIETRLREESGAPADKVVTQLIPLKYAAASEIKKLFAPLVSKSSIILDYSPTNTLIVTDVYSNIQRLTKILEAIDILKTGRELSIITLIYADVQDMAKALNSVFGGTVSKAKKSAGQTRIIKFVADDRTNTLIILASEGDTIKIKELIAVLDKETPKGKESIHVYYLENAIAEDLAIVLEAIPSKKSNSKTSKAAPIVSSKVRITADKATNSLIITAEKEDYLILEAVIRDLDIPRSMVYIECLIMEVDVEKDFLLGTEWIIGDQFNFNGDEYGATGGFSGNDPGFSNLRGLSGGLTGIAQYPPGYSMGVFGDGITVGGVTFPSLGAIVQAYKKDEDINFLSTPQILTMDNEEATIYVGRNVAFQTRSAAETGTETYSSYEYKDVGVTLKITPHISLDRFVRLVISQEVTQLDDLATVSADRPATLKRSIETTVIVKDKSTVVIGGLIDDSMTRTSYKVPCLGDIPVIGWLFKTDSNAVDKTNLFIFLTPKVVANPAEAQALYEVKREAIEKYRQDQTGKTMAEEIQGDLDEIDSIKE